MINHSFFQKPSTLLTAYNDQQFSKDIKIYTHKHLNMYLCDVGVCKYFELKNFVQLKDARAVWNINY